MNESEHTGFNDRDDGCNRLEAYLEARRPQPERDLRIAYTEDGNWFAIPGNVILENQHHRIDINPSKYYFSSAGIPTRSPAFETLEEALTAARNAACEFSAYIGDPGKWDQGVLILTSVGVE